MGELALFMAVFLGIAYYAGNRLAGMWWVFPVILMPMLLATNALGKRLGFGPPPSNSEGQS